MALDSVSPVTVVPLVDAAAAASAALSYTGGAGSITLLGRTAPTTAPLLRQFDKIRLEKKTVEKTFKRNKGHKGQYA